MGKGQKTLLDISFPDEERAREFALFCLNKFNSAPAVNRRDIYLVLQNLDDRAAALLEAEKLGGVVLRNDE